MFDNPQRFKEERQLLRRVYPECKFVKLEGQLRVRAIITHSGTHYEAELVYPRNFPWDPIRAYIRDPIISDAPHLWGNDELCLDHGEHITPQTTGVQIMDWVIEWVNAYERYQRTGDWPDRVRKNLKRKGRR